MTITNCLKQIFSGNFQLIVFIINMATNSNMKPIVLHLYRSLFRKARIATKGQDHLFRFQREPSSELWGKGLMYDIKYDRQLLETIFPSSIHQFFDNKYPFNPKLWNDSESEKKLHSEFYPDYVKDPYFDHGYNLITKEEKLKTNINKTSTPKSSALYNKNQKEGYIINEYDYYRLKYTIKRIFNHYRFEKDISKINELINDGFNVLKEFDVQISINNTTSVSESYGIRIIATSIYIDSIIGHDPYKPYSFSYRIRIENHGHSWIQLLGRHWVIVDNNNNKEILERFQPGVVGLQPQLNPGDIFLYGSGTFMPTNIGKMYGALQFTNMNGELFEVPISTFKLIAVSSTSSQK